MDKRKQFVDSALKCLGTRFHHQGRVQESGLDCVGLVVCAARSIGVSIVDYTNYRRFPTKDSLMKYMKDYTIRKDPKKASFGDILVFWIDPGLRYSQHVAIMSYNGKMIHSYSRARKVVEVSFGQYWKERLTHVLSLKGLN